MAVALKADECQIYTDVDGVYTTDPRVYDKAKKIDKLCFEEMLELSGLGAKVLQIRSVEFASKFNMPIRVLSSFEPGGGTLIDNEDENLENALISGVTHTKNDSKLIIRKVPDLPGIAAKILSPISKEGIEVDVIVQNVAEDKTTDFTFTVKDEDADKAAKILNNLSDELGGGNVELAKEISKVSVVGVGMKSHAGVATKMFSALAEKNIIELEKKLSIFFSQGKSPITILLFISAYFHKLSLIKLYGPNSFEVRREYPFLIANNLEKAKIQAQRWSPEQLALVSNFITISDLKLRKHSSFFQRSILTQCLRKILKV